MAGNQFREWLYGTQKKPGRPSLPIEEVLRRWQTGETVAQIIDAVVRQDGSKYSRTAIYDAVRKAREEGDPRAIKRR